jgi:hypothetical protein
LARALKAAGRFARLTAKAAAGGDSAAGLNRSALSAMGAVCAFVRAGLVRAGVDPARTRALRLAPSLAADQIEEAEQFVIDDADGLAGIFGQKIADLVRRYEDGREPDFANASLAELLAWCLARPENAV